MGRWSCFPHRSGVMCVSQMVGAAPAPPLQVPALGAWESAASRPSIPASPVLRLAAKSGKGGEKKRKQKGKGKCERPRGREENRAVGRARREGSSPLHGAS